MQDPKVTTTTSSILKLLVSCLITQPFQIFFKNKQMFLSIFAFLTLPLSLLLLSISLSSNPIKSQILRLESVAALSSTRFEARHVWKESREAAVALIHLNLLFSIPSFALSLLAAVSSVVCAESGYNRSPISFMFIFNAVRSTWVTILVTSIYVYLILSCYSIMPPTLWVLTGGGKLGSGFVIWAVGSAFKIYLMAVLGMGLVVSVLERRFGWDAIKAGSELMEGNRVCGWVLSGWMGLVTGLIGCKMEELKGNGDNLASRTRRPAVVMLNGGERLGLIAFYGIVMVWGYVVATVYYCECRRRHVVREGEDHGGSNEVRLVM